MENDIYQGSAFTGEAELDEFGDPVVIDLEGTAFEQRKPEARYRGVG